QRLVHSEPGRHHIGRQLGFQKVAQLPDSDRCSRRHDVRHQTLIAIGVFAQNHHTVTNVTVASQSLFDLFQLDAEAANLDLIVGPSQKLNISIGAIADEIAGLVELLALEVAERIGNEFFGAKLGPLDVTTRHASASKMQLSGHADRNRLEELIQNIG